MKVVSNNSRWKSKLKGLAQCQGHCDVTKQWPAIATYLSMTQILEQQPTFKQGSFLSYMRVGIIPAKGYFVFGNQHGVGPFCY